MWKSIILKRILPSAFSLCGVIVIAFVLTRALPGDPACFSPTAPAAHTV